MINIQQHHHRILSSQAIVEIPDIPTDALMHWTLDNADVVLTDPAGTQIKDSTGNGNTGDSKAINEFEKVVGIVGDGALMLTGVNNHYIASPPMIPHGAHSISMWVNPQIGDVYTMFTTQRGPGGNYYQFYCGEIGGNIHPIYWNGSSSVVHPDILPRDTWTYIACTHDGVSTLKLYVGYNTPVTYVLALGSNSTENLLVGRDGPTGSNNARGGIDDIVMYSRELSESEIKQLRERKN